VKRAASIASLASPRAASIAKDPKQATHATIRRTLATPLPHPAIDAKDAMTRNSRLPDPPHLK